ncbi:MAG: hypothetical protein N3A66_00795, partial [Planctomycetota bacterium]|nr:hypothetical protein [Planctomycetota bacterium]
MRRTIVLRLGLMVLGSAFLCCLSLTGEGLQGTQVDPLDGNTYQDGQVNEKEARRFVADEIEKEGAPPEAVVRLRKTFTPPPGWKFRPFRPEEKNLTRIRQALRVRQDPHDAINWPFWMHEPAYVDIWFDPEDALIFGEPPSTFRSRAEIEGPDLIRVSGVLADSQKAARFPLRCDGNLVPPSGGQGGVFKEFHWSAVVAGAIDLDVDTDNTNGVYGGPDRDLVNEDRWERDGGKYAKTGKYVPRNDGDTDHDQIPGFADGFGKFGEKSAQSAAARFVPAVLDVSNVEDVIDWNQAKIRFRYSASDPNATQEKTLPPLSAEGATRVYWEPGPGMLRIWTRDGGEMRNPLPVSQGGDWVKDEEFLAAKLFKGRTVVTLYLEGIQQGVHEGLIEVEFSPLGDEPWLPDEVKVTVVHLDLDVDSDNTAKNGEPERDGYEDRIEDAGGDAPSSGSIVGNEEQEIYPGKIIAVNDADFDADGIPDFADGFDAFADSANDNLIASGSSRPSFTPIVLELPSPLDPAKCRLRIAYAASDPRQVSRSGNAKDGFTYTAGSGNLRLWKKNADAARSKKPVKEGGDWVEPGEYAGADLAKLGLGSKVTLWLEGIAAADRLRISAEVDPDGASGPAGYVHEDAVRVTIVRVDLDVDADRDGQVEDNEEDDRGEDTWTRKKGAIVLVNCDNDDPPPAGFAGIDNANAVVDGDEDAKDLAKLIARKIQIDSFPDSVKLILRIEKPQGVTDDPLDIDAGKRIRIFWKRGAAYEHILGMEKPERKEFAGTELDAFKDGDVEFGIEGVEHAAQVDIVLELTENGFVYGIDRVRVMTAPLLFLSNIETSEKIYVCPGTPLAQFLKTTFGNLVRETDPRDQWDQDEWQIGFSSMPLDSTVCAVMPTVLGLPRGGLQAWGRANFPGKVPFADLPHLPVGDDIFYGYIEKGSRPATSASTYGGNLEVSPPVDGYPFGRIIVGSNMAATDPDLVKFLASQRLQAKHIGASNYEIIQLNVDWLTVGHIDEYMNFIPVGDRGDFAVLMA